MSQDLALYNICDHKILEEPLSISPTTLRAKLNYPTSGNVLQIQVFRKYWDTIIPYGAWILDVDKQTLIFSSGSVLIDPTLMPQPIYLCDYITLAPNCPKCQGANVMSDITYLFNGQVLGISDSAKLKQYVKKALITNITSNALHQDYGTYLTQLIPNQLTPQVFMKINFTFENIAQTLIGYQSQSYNLNNKEILYDLTNVNMQQITPINLGINITILNREYEEIFTSIEGIL